MKRSKGRVIQTKDVGWNLAEEGIKICTSRYGDRTSDYEVGTVYDFKNNDTDRILKIKITKLEVKKLKDITTEDAMSIQNYSWPEMVYDVYDIYHNHLEREVNEDTEFTLTWFEVQR